jgi:hypothetical protein
MLTFEIAKKGRFATAENRWRRQVNEGILAQPGTNVNAHRAVADAFVGRTSSAQMVRQSPQS